LLLFVSAFVNFFDLWSVSQAEEEELDDLMTGIKNDSFYAGLVIIAIGIVGPFVEEIVTRAGCMGTLKRHMNPYLAVSLSSLIFGAIHLNLTQFIYTSICGVIFGWVTLWCGNIYAGFIVHATLNGIQSIISAIEMFSPDVKSVEENDNFSLIIMFLVGLAITAICLYFMYKKYKTDEKEKKLLKDLQAVDAPTQLW